MQFIYTSTHRRTTDLREFAVGVVLARHPAMRKVLALNTTLFANDKQAKLHAGKVL